MIITNYNRNELKLCCQMRYDWYLDMKESPKTPTGNISMKYVDKELYSRFNAFIIGSILLENMGKETCLDCLHFRHKGLSYYSITKRKDEAEKLKEQLEKRNHGKS